MTTAKVFNAVALALKETHATSDTIDRMAEVFESTNPRFDRARFVAASSQVCDDVARSL